MNAVIVGLEAIGEQFGRTRWTIRRWIDQESFPASKLPDGTWTTTQGLVEQWIRGRMASATIGEVGSEDPFRTELCRAEQ